MLIIEICPISSLPIGSCFVINCTQAQSIVSPVSVLCHVFSPTLPDYVLIFIYICIFSDPVMTPFLSLFISHLEDCASHSILR